MQEKEYKINEQEYNLLNEVLRQSFNLCRTVSYPAVFSYVNEEGTIIKKPKEEDLITGKVKKVLNDYDTFKDDNVSVSFDATKLTREMLMMQDLLVNMRIRDINVNIEEEVK